jgi:NADH-quinone oxidoreductase subunit K
METRRKEGNVDVTLGHYLALSAAIFTLGSVGFLARRNVLIQFMCIELMLNGVILSLIGINRWYPHNHAGQVFAFFVIAVAAAEAAVGLAIAISLFRVRQTIHTDQIDSLKH